MSPNVEDVAVMASKLGMCAVIGPVPGPGLLPYLCTLSIGHDGAHVARALQDGTVYDSWA